MPHNFSLNEPIVLALTSQLTNQLPPAITQVNADVPAGGITIQAPAQIIDHVPVLTTLAGGGFPAIAIEDLGTTFQDDLVSSVTGVHKLAVIAFISNPDPTGLAWQLRRYQQAILLALQTDRTLNGAAWTTRLTGINPGPALEFQPGDLQGNTSRGFLSWFAVELEIPREEV